MALTQKALKDAIFHAQSKPQELYDILFPFVRDTAVATKVFITGDSTLQLSATETVTSEAPTVVVKDQYDIDIGSPTVTFAIKQAVTGCTVNSSTGVLSATTSAVAGAKPVIVATCGSKTAELEVTLTAAG